MSADADNACQYVRLPSAETVEALHQAQTDTDLVEYLTLEELQGQGVDTAARVSLRAVHQSLGEHGEGGDAAFDS